MWKYFLFSFFKSTLDTFSALLFSVDKIENNEPQEDQIAERTLVNQLLDKQKIILDDSSDNDLR